jgi:hypothetical protein
MPVPGIPEYDDVERPLLSRTARATRGAFMTERNVDPQANAIRG